MKKTCKDFIEFTKKYKKSILIQFILILAVYGYTAFSTTIGIDTEIAATHPIEQMGWLGIGRQGLVFTKLLLGLRYFHPFVEACLFVLSFLFVSISISFLIWSTSNKKDYHYGIFMAVYALSAIWMPQFYFGLQRAETMLGILYSIISVYSFVQIVFFAQKQWYWFVLGLMFGVWSFCSYQSCVAVFISLVIISMLNYYLNDDSRQIKDYILKISFFILAFIVIFVLNTMITKQFFLSNEAYLDNQTLWTKAPITTILYNILGFIFSTLTLRKDWYISIYPLACIMLCFLFFVVYKNKKHRWILFLILLGLVLSPFLLSMYMGSVPVSRSQFTTQLVSAYIFMLFLHHIPIYLSNKYAKMLHLLMITGVCIINIYSVLVIYQMQYTEEVRYKNDVKIAQEIYSDLKGQSFYDKDIPVVFVGKLTPEYNFPARKTDMFGVSFFEWDYSEGNPSLHTNRIVDFMNINDMDLISGYSQYSMDAMNAMDNKPSYPESGYISNEKDYILIKLSD